MAVKLITFYLEPWEEKKLTQRLKTLGYSGKGHLAAFCRKVIGCNKVMFFEGDFVEFVEKNGVPK